MNRLHQCIVAFCAASLAFVALSGSVAQATPRPSTEIEAIREMVQHRESSDGGCR